jgi:hypothetical protein
MDIVIIALLAVGAFVIGIVGNITASELYDCTPTLSRWIIDRAVARMPERNRDRYREEWYANHEDWRGGKLGKLWHALGCYFSTRALNEIAEKKLKQELGHSQDEDEAKRLKRLVQLLKAFKQQEEERHALKIYTTNFDVLAAEVILRVKANNESPLEALCDQLSKELNKSS